MTTQGPITFFVPGIPRPQGSKRSIPLKRRDGSYVTRPNGQQATVLVEDNPRTKDWRGDVRRALQDAYHGQPLDGPVKSIITFTFPRPASHYGRRNGEPYLKDSAPRWQFGRAGDIEKLVRAIHDAVKNIAFADDKQVVCLLCAKQYGTPVGAQITFATLPPGPPRETDHERLHDTTAND